MKSEARPAYIGMLFVSFLVVYIGAKEIHVDLKQCMKLDVLNVNRWQLNGRILRKNV